MGLKESGLRGSLRSVSTGVRAIPDSEGLQIRLDWTEEDGSMPVSDQSENGNDLDSGSYTGVGESIGGNQAGEFDNDTIYAEDIGVELSPPFTVLVVIDTPSNDDTIPLWGDDTDGGGGLLDIGRGGGSDEFGVANEFGGGDVADTPSVLTTEIHDTDDASLRQDGETVATGDARTTGLDGFGVGGRGPDEDFQISDSAIGEILLYDGDDRGRNEDAEDYLMGRWAI